MIHSHDPGVEKFIISLVKDGYIIEQIINIARVGAIGELQEEYVMRVISDYLKPNQKAKTETIDGKKIVSEHESKFDRYVASLEFIKAIFDTLNIINKANHDKKLKDLDKERSNLIVEKLKEVFDKDLKKILEEKKLTPPSRQEPRVIKEGEQPKKPTLDEISDRIRMSKNYRIAEKDGVFWIEELKMYDRLEKWVVIDTITYRSLELCKSHLNIIIETKLIKHTETKYHYL
jgi:hypothetical protein